MSVTKLNYRLRRLQILVVSVTSVTFCYFRLRRLRPSNDWPLPSDPWRFPSKILWRLGCRQVAGGQIIFSRKNWVATSLVKTGFVSTHPDRPGPQASQCHVIVATRRGPLVTWQCPRVRDTSSYWPGVQATKRSFQTVSDRFKPFQTVSTVSDRRFPPILIANKRNPQHQRA